MRIVVNDIAASSGGALSVLQDFYSFAKQQKEIEWIFLLGDNYIEETDNVKVVLLPEIKQSHIKKLKFDFVTGRKLINSIKPDGVISLQNIITFGVKAPQIAFVHQAIPFQDTKKFSFLKADERGLAVYQYIIGHIVKKSAKKADAVAVQTNWMKQAVQKKAKAKNVFVCTPTITAETREAKPCSNSFFYPTSDLIYKNNDCIYKAIQILNEEGISDFNVRLTLDKKDKMNNVEFIGRLSRTQVMEEYLQSVLVFPSYLESFGYPLAEAKQTGTIILSSDAPVTRDALGDYENGYYFNPFCPNELAGLMKKVITGEIVQKKIQKSKDNNISNWQIMLSALQEMIK